MAGVPELLACAIMKQVAVKLGSAIWKEIGAQMNLSEDLKDLETTFAAVKNVLRKADKRSDGEKIVWIEELKDAAYDMEDMLMDFEHEISPGISVSELNTPTKVTIPVRLRMTMPGKLKHMKRRLEKIAKLKELDFTPGISSGDQEGFHNLTARVARPEGPLPGEDIVGRTREKEAMMRLLQQDCEHSIIPIYGFGGFGKTTLARMVFEESKTTGGFEKLVWVNVTEKFNLEGIGRSIICQVEGQPSTQYDYTSVQLHVAMILRDKQSLIILDDIWEDDEDILEELRVLLGVAKNSRNKEIGSKRIKVILTTRNKGIAKLMNEQFQFKLDELPYDDCLKLFRAKAFPPSSRNVESRVEKEKVGEMIVQKCKGFPLAVKSIGRRLRDADLKTWKKTLQSDPWLKVTNPTRGTTSTAVLDSLKLSYSKMPECLRPCFAYFSMFPKGFVVDKKDLLQQWIALGFVASEHGADEYLSELTDMSFLQTVRAAPSIPARYSEHRSEVYQMHDFVHALATSIAGEEVAMLLGSQGGNSSSRMARCRYILFSNFAGQALECSNMPLKARAMQFKDCRGLRLPPDIFSKAKWLRILDFSGMGTVELPESMINLHHLQVLNLSENTGITKLWSRITNFHLYRLHYLDLHGCSNLRDLPDSIGKLKELLNLDLSKCTSLQELPVSFGDLQNLSSLNLSFCYQLKTVPETFSKLTNLEELNMSGCSFNQLPTRLFNKMEKLNFLDLSSCTELAELPGSSEGLRALQYLNLSDCSKLQNILGLLTKFVNLKYLNLSRVGGSGGTEAPGTSVGGISNHSGHGLQLRELHGVLKCLRNLEYLVVGGLTLFSEQGIGGIDELITLPDFVVRQRDARCSNITLLQSITDLTHNDLNIRCLENVGSPEEASAVGLENKRHLRSLSLEWSLSEYDEADKEKDKGVLQNLRPNRSLKNLAVKGYTPDSFPEWIMMIHHKLPELVKIVLSDLSNCRSIPPLRCLPKLEDIEIRRMPMLQVIWIGQCKNLRRLSLVELPYGTTVRLDDDTRGVEVLSEVHESGHDHYNLEAEEETDYLPNSDGHMEEQETNEPPIDNNPNKKQGNIFAKAIGLLKGLNCVPRRDHATPLIPEAPQESLSRPLGPCQEAKAAFIMQLNCLNIEGCVDLSFCPSIPQSMEYIIRGTTGLIRSNQSILLDPDEIYSYTPQLTSKLHLQGCTELIGADTFRCLDGVSVVELVITDWYPYDLDRLIVHLDNLRILRIINCGDMELDLERILAFISLHELEIGVNTQVRNLKSLHNKLNKLEKLIMIPSLEDIATLDVPYVITKESIWFSVQTMNKDMFGSCPSRHASPRQTILANSTSTWPRKNSQATIQTDPKCSCSNIAVLLESYYPEIKRLVIKNLEKVKGPEEVREGDFCRHYHELESLSLMWSSSENSDSTVHDDPRIANNDVAVLEKLRPPPCLSTLRLEGYWHSAVCYWLLNLSSVLPNLVRIELAMCEQLPPLGQLEHLIILTISHCCNLVALPESIRGCRSLKELEISECWNLAELPEWLGELTSLTTLIIHAAKLERLPRSIRCLTSLKKLVLKKCNNKLREWCNSGENRDIIQHVANTGCLDTSEEPDIFISSSGITLLQKTSSPHLHELNIKDLECVSSSSEAKKIELMSKEELQSLSLEWSSYKREPLSKLDTAVLEELQPHPNLERLCIKNYCGFEFPNWMHLFKNLVRLELSNCQIGCLCLDHLQNLEDLCISSFRILNVNLQKERRIVWCEEYPTESYYNGNSRRNIVSTRTLKNLRKVTICGVRNLVWETSTSSISTIEFFKNFPSSTGSESSLSTTDNLFPGLEYLELNTCSNLRFTPSIPRSARYQISGCKTEPDLFEWPSFQRVMGLATSASSSKMVIKHSKFISSRPSDSLVQLEIEELTVDNCIDSVPLPECIRGWKSLRKIEILNCEDMETLPEWLGDMASLRELKVETYWMKNLPPCIERLTSLQTLVLSKCTKRFKQRCSEGGDDWSKINHIENLIVEERKP